jgi:hypothetical protein
MSLKIYVKTTKEGAPKMELVAEPGEKIEKYVSEIAQFFDFNEDFKIAYKGRILEKSDTFEKCGFQNNEVVIIVGNKKKNDSPPQVKEEKKEDDKKEDNDNVASTSDVSASSHHNHLGQSLSQNGFQQMPNSNLYFQFRSYPSGGNDPNQQQETNNLTWQEFTEQNDRVDTSPHLYNIEQIHAGFISLMRRLVNDPVFSNNIMLSPDAAIRHINNERHRNMIRDLMSNIDQEVTTLRDDNNHNEQNNNVVDPPPQQPSQPSGSHQSEVNALRNFMNMFSLLGGGSGLGGGALGGSGLGGGVLGGSGLGGNALGGSALGGSALGGSALGGNNFSFTSGSLPNENVDDEEEEEYDEAENVEILGNGENLENIANVENANPFNPGQNVDLNQELNDQDKENLENLKMICPNAPEELVAKVYLECQKNMEVAANTILSMFEQLQF